MLVVDMVSTKKNDHSRLRLVETSVTRTQQHFAVTLKSDDSKEIKKGNVAFDRFNDTPLESARKFCKQQIASLSNMMSACVQEVESFILRTVALDDA